MPTLTATTGTTSPANEPTTRDVAQAAWLGLSRNPHHTTPWTPSQPAHTTVGIAPCARCAHPDATTPVKDCISRSFTGYDTWRSPMSPVLCAACAWCYRTPGVRSMVLLVGDRGWARQLTRPQACRVLLRGLGEHQSLVLPLRGRKHLLAQAGWGAVSSEAGTVVWGPVEAALLADVVTARAAGASGKDLASATVPWPLMVGLSPSARVELMGLWSRLEPLRRSDLRLHVASVVTSPDKDARGTPLPSSAGI